MIANLMSMGYFGGLIQGFWPMLSLLTRLEISRAEGHLEFPEREVLLISANRAQLTKLIETSDDIAEFRKAKEVSSFFIELENRDQLEFVRELLDRTSFSNEEDVAVCILDTGINNGHLLIAPVLSDADLHTYLEEWGVEDHDGHGTLMAGTVAYGDLLSILDGNDTVRVDHRLESAKIMPPRRFGPNHKRLWGYITIQGISRAEIQAPGRKRISCMAITSEDPGDRGRPSSWSSSVDELASGSEDGTQRLIVVSAGNVQGTDEWRNYSDSNLTNEIHDPAQAWNALTVGAFTEKVRIDDDQLTEYTPIAPLGGLSPFSTTSATWPPHKWPVKPEVVFEGGNVAQDPSGEPTQVNDLKLISTYRDPNVAQFAPFCATSAAAAQAARMGARIWVQYPEAWPETIRGLIVHSAEWNEGIKSQFLRGNSKTHRANLLKICGYGIPDMDRALFCTTNSLTLISQATMQPFDRRDNNYVTRDMHLYDLPWPTEVLSQLGEVQVQLRVTLSYFIEPGPGEVGWEYRYRYASHGLRFDINGPSESEEEFVQRVNYQARESGEHPGTSGISDKWAIGSDTRNVGSIHSDIWTGSAVELASSNKIAVYPTIGWWRERHHLNRWSKQCRYALIISINTPTLNVDIYTPVAVQIGVTVPVEITVGGEQG
jgi:hypothetical protein